MTGGSDRCSNHAAGHSRGTPAQPAGSAHVLGVDIRQRGDPERGLGRAKRRSRSTSPSSAHPVAEAQTIISAPPGRSSRTRGSSGRIPASWSSPARGAGRPARHAARAFIETVGNLDDGDLAPTLDVEADTWQKTGMKPPQLLEGVRAAWKTLKPDGLLPSSTRAAASGSRSSAKFPAPDLAESPLWVKDYPYKLRTSGSLRPAALCLRSAGSADASTVGRCGQLVDPPVSGRCPCSSPDSSAP